MEHVHFESVTGLSQQLKQQGYAQCRRDLMNRCSSKKLRPNSLKESMRWFVAEGIKQKQNVSYLTISTWGIIQCKGMAIMWDLSYDTALFWLLVLMTPV